jgi:hypothetical protein
MSQKEVTQRLKLLEEKEREIKKEFKKIKQTVKVEQRGKTGDDVFMFRDDTKHGHET